MFDRLRDISRQIAGNQFFLSALGLSLFFYLYIYRLGNLVKGFSPAELSAVKSSASLSSIWHYPVYAPHKLLQLGLRHFLGYSPTSLRLASAVFAGIFLLCVYLLCSRWFGQLIGSVCTLFLATLPWVTLLGRSATPSIMLLISSLILVAYYFFARSKKQLLLSWLVFCFCLGLSLYVPGILLILLAGSLINRRSLIFSIKRLSIMRILLGGLMILAMLTPLILAVIRTPSLLHHWLLVPISWVGYVDFGKNLAWAFSGLFIHSRIHFEWAVGRLPLLTVLISVLAIFGAYAMKLQARQKLYAILALIFFGCLASAANANYVYLSFCVVPLILLSAAGLRFLFLQWQSIFPKNPLPRYFAYSLIILLAAGQLAYGVRATLYAWPRTSETQSTFVLK